jgi:hypothetical protein
MGRKRKIKRRRKGPLPDYVPHPRYGCEPRRTGLDPDQSEPGVWLHFNTHHNRKIAGTAVVAQCERQVAATIPVSHYYDVERTCRDCGRLFLFYAAEQKHWYEVLGFKLDADCVRCYPCRRRTHQVQARRFRYEELVGLEARTSAQELELAQCRLQLIEDGLLSAPRHADEVRAFLNRHPDHPDAASIRERLAGLSVDSARSAPPSDG